MSSSRSRPRRALRSSVAAVLLGLALTVSGVLIAGPAAADAVDDAVSALREDRLYVDPASGLVVDEAAVEAAIGNQDLLIAVLPASSGDAFSSASQIGLSLPGNTVAVIVDGEFRAGSDILCAGVADEIAGDAVQGNLDELDASEVTGALVDFATDLRSAPGQDDCEEESGGSGWLWFAGIGVVGLAGIGGYVVYRRRRQAEHFEGRRAEILSLYNRLAADVTNLSPGDDPVTRQAVADASERYTSTGALLDEADTEGEYDAARRAVVEGLIAARTARQRLGLDLGPPLPDLEAPEGEQLTEEREVTVGDETVRGYPRYTPGAPHYYRGGRGIPGGWYPNRFWEGVLIGRMMDRDRSWGSSEGRWDGDRPGAAAPRRGWRTGSGSGGGGGGGDWGLRAGGGDWGRRSTPRRNTWGGGGARRARGIGRIGGRSSRNKW